MAPRHARLVATLLRLRVAPVPPPALLTRPTRGGAAIAGDGTKNRASSSEQKTSLGVSVQIGTQLEPLHRSRLTH